MGLLPILQKTLSNDFNRLGEKCPNRRSQVAALPIP
jgi:hypothetical protein